ncbi:MULTISPECIES: imidazole glycerol phosphate synthase subunit HisH [Spirosoma]|uniref:Imidazole glycerol phosphate synthase subunit HisH n=1 Tax=Spirosoma liriopis TaxID=2937440 RepID=A0ABT0HSU1_9BACT|nr:MULTISPECIES: imidazole glycerol phosphate synthase subunit HisH [Spirosoma]MCK8494902.1 imidazole glycerol phosphate synthase subunit HisH [Spirosoma liriopis]UHG94028.1 imidazole glycerol phosphate synthase subunit HisH [Spirosoma oryzicola]
MSPSDLIVIVDYGMGNLRSVQKTFDRLKANVRISSDPNVLARADKLVLPGVGHFANGVRKLKELGLWNALNHKVIIERTPILGICLGMQLMARWSEEGDVEGLGWFDADVRRFAVSNCLTYKVPHMGWNTAETAKTSGLFANMSPEAMFYFVHSYHVVCRQPQDALALTTYDYAFASAIQKENIYGTQFHPEKSHDWGEQLIANFLNV